MSDAIGSTVIRGVFALPIGVHFLRRECEPVKSVLVSTVCLDGAHLRDPLGICDAEIGYETMVFLDGCTFFSLYQTSYSTREKAIEGHRSTVEQILAQTLPLSIKLAHYFAFEEEQAA